HNDDELVAGGAAWRIVAELSPKDGEPVVQKHHGDSFEATDLEDVLAGLGVGRVVVAGAATDFCIRATLHGALVRGYDTTLVGDAHTTVDHSAHGAPSPDLVVAHTNFYWSHQTAPGRVAETVPAAEVKLG
ncbi:MAG: isochorismatase family protein, partial [Hamadaea sp.]|nr:isochorismatase family protein [Hamadaea sp.]